HSRPAPRVTVPSARQTASLSSAGRPGSLPAGACPHTPRAPRVFCLLLLLMIVIFVFSIPAKTDLQISLTQNKENR
ncbi:hypothetical protein B5E15_26245, partial [Salmonella enterica]|nr:hypothetical protein [Salmonella enterica]